MNLGGYKFFLVGGGGKWGKEKRRRETARRRLAGGGGGGLSRHFLEELCDVYEVVKASYQSLGLQQRK